jgi:hypothetical protein
MTVTNHRQRWSWLGCIFLLQDVIWGLHWDMC